MTNHVSGPLSVKKMLTINMWLYRESIRLKIDHFLICWFFFFPQSMSFDDMMFRRFTAEQIWDEWTFNNNKLYICKCVVLNIGKKYPYFLISYDK